VKVSVCINQKAALKRGLDAVGWRTIEVPIEALTVEERLILAEQPVRDCAYQIKSEVAEPTVEEIKIALKKLAIQAEQEIVKYLALDEETIRKGARSQYRTLSAPDHLADPRVAMHWEFEQKIHADERAKIKEEKILEYLALDEEQIRQNTRAQRRRALIFPDHLADPRVAMHWEFEQKIHADEQAKIKEEKQAEDKQKQAKMDKLRDWALAEGSELLVARIEEGLPWQKLARSQFIVQHAPEGYASISEEGLEVQDRTNPQMDEITELRRLRKLVAESQGALADPELAWYVIEADDCDPAATEKFPVVRIRVVCPDGSESWVEKRFDV
jgi:hypothetical protein